jgi:hypothetical protein
MSCKREYSTKVTGNGIAFKKMGWASGADVILLSMGCLVIFPRELKRKKLNIGIIKIALSTLTPKFFQHFATV